ncbi:MAG: hypothetical protein RI554_05600, partial [Trueperaceae bacterium]|nr:hypothetical protein [Trueperaceae bacterium]
TPLTATPLTATDVTTTDVSPTAAPPTRSPSRPDLDVTRDGATLVARRGDATPWRHARSPAGGPLTAAVVRPDGVWFAQGASLVRLDPATGVATQRRALPGPATALAADGDALRVGYALADGGTTVRTVDPSTAGPPVRFGVAPATFTALRRGAADAADPVAAAERDPTDPWRALRAAQAAPEDDARWRAAADAAAAAPFFEAFGVATALLDAGRSDLARTTFEAAARDLAARGYDPRLATDPALRAAYGFPDAALHAAAEAGDVPRVRILAPAAWRVAAPQVPASRAALAAAADALAAADDPDAATWRARAEALRPGLARDPAAATVAALGRLGVWGAAALAATFALVWTTIVAKAWRAQHLLLKQRRERGRHPVALGRAWAPRYASTTEKLVLLALLLAAATQLVIAGTHARGADVAPALRSGTLASEDAQRALASLPDGPYADLLRGLGHLQRGDRAAALDAWRAAGDLAEARTNLATLDAPDGGAARVAAFEAALALDPREPVARWALGRGPDPSPLHATLTPDAPLYAVPTPHEVRRAAGADLRAALADAVRRPWAALPAALPAGVPAWAGGAALGLAALLALGTTLQLLVPRPRLLRRAPRTFAYHLLALVVPGAGHADEGWGLLLLVPWALLGADALLGAQGGGAGPLGLAPVVSWGLLAALYAVNLVGFVVETLHDRERMWGLREREPELARAFGLPEARGVRR